MKLNIFELKARDKKLSNPTQSQIVAMYGNTAKYSTANYPTMAKEGYKENFLIFRCLNIIIDACSQAEWGVWQYDSEGKYVKIDGHPIEKLLNKPNPQMNKEKFIEMMIAYYYIGGEIALQKIKSTSGIGRLFIYRPDKITLDLTGESDEPYKNIKYNNSINIKAEEFGLFKTFDPMDELNGMGRGMSLLAPIAKSGDMLNAAYDWNIAMLQNGGNPSGAFVTDQIMGDDEYQRTKTALQNEHGGAKKVGKMLLLEGGLKYQKTGENPKDMDWSNGKESAVIDICTGMGVDPILAGYNQFSSYNNMKEAKKGLFTSKAIPLMNNISGFLTEFLELGENEYIEASFDHVAVLRENETERMKRINEDTTSSINEKRVMKGQEPIDGGDVIGDVIVIDGKVYIPMNLQEIGVDTKRKEPAKKQHELY